MNRLVNSLLILFLFIISSENLKGITLYSQSSGDWGGSSSTPNLFNSQPDGSGTFYNASDPITYNTTTTDIIIQSGHIINCQINMSINTLLIELNGVLQTTSNNIGIVLHNGTLTVDGELGNGIPQNPFGQSGFLVNFNGNNNVINGTGLITIQRLILENANGLTIETDVNLFSYSSQANDWFSTLENKSTGDLTLSAGNTLNVYGNFGPDIDADPVWNNFNLSRSTLSFDIHIDGTLNIFNGQLLLRSNNSTGSTHNININAGGRLFTESYIYASGGSGDPLNLPGFGVVNLKINGTWETQADDPIQYLGSRSSAEMIAGSTAVFSGGSTQNIESDVNLGGYGNIEVAGTGSKGLEGNILFGGDLSLTSAGLKLGAFNLTSIKNLLSFEGIPFLNYSETLYIETNGSGTLQVYFPSGGSISTGILYPIGNTSYNPIYVYNEGPADLISLRQENALYLNGTSGTKANTNVVESTWFISEDDPSNTNLGIFVYWVADDELSGFSSDNCWIAHHDGTEWDQQTPMAAGISDNLKFLQRTGITNLSPFGVLSSNTILPVEYLDFGGFQNESHILLSWTTAIEEENEGFSVEHSSDGRNFRTIGYLDGKGDAEWLNEYQLLHENPVNGVNYYRLKQIDMDGTFEYSKIIGVNYSENNYLKDFSVFPSLAQNQLFIEQASSDETPRHYYIFDLHGKVVKNYITTDAKVTLDISSLPAGSYLIKEGYHQQVELFIKQ